MHLQHYVIIVICQIEHDITNVKELSSITIEFCDNEKREWLELLLFARPFSRNVNQECENNSLPRGKKNSETSQETSDYWDDVVCTIHMQNFNWRIG